MRAIQIKECEWGVANHFGDFIEIHKDLTKFPKLRHQILKHELGHTDQAFTIHDLKHDLKTDVDKKALFHFMIRRPKTWIQFLPFYYQRSKGFVWDPNLMLGYLLGIVIFGGGIGLLILILS